MAALLFCDLVDSTALSSRLGEAKADEMRVAFFGRLREAGVGRGGGEGKNLGDRLLGSVRSVGEAKADEMRVAFFGRLREAVMAEGGDEVKNLGDGLMVSFRSVAEALRCAEAMQVGIARLAQELDLSLAIRVGVSAGEAKHED